MKKAFIFITIFLLLQASGLKAFELQEFNGSEIKLDDKIGQGKWSLVMIWAHDCHVCRVEYPLFSEFHKNRPDVDVIGISIDGEANKHLAQNFLDTTKPSFTSYITSIELLAANYQILTEEPFRGTPTFLLFKPNGELLGNNPGMLPVEALEKFIENNS